MPINYTTYDSGLGRARLESQIGLYFTQLSYDASKAELELVQVSLGARAGCAEFTLKWFIYSGRPQILWLAPFMDGPDGKIAHAELKIGDSVIMLSDEMPGSETRWPQSLGGTTSGVFLYVKTWTQSFTRQPRREPRLPHNLRTCFWGDRYAKVMDPYGHSWSLATHKEDAAPAKLKKRAEAHMSKMAEMHRTRTA